MNAYLIRYFLKCITSFFLAILLVGFLSFAVHALLTSGHFIEELLQSHVWTILFLNAALMALPVSFFGSIWLLIKKLNSAQWYVQLKLLSPQLNYFRLTMLGCAILLFLLQVKFATGDFISNNSNSLIKKINKRSVKQNSFLHFGNSTLFFPKNSQTAEIYNFNTEGELKYLGAGFLAHIKNEVLLERVVGRSIELKPFSENFKATLRLKNISEDHLNKYYLRILKSPVFPVGSVRFRKSILHTVFSNIGIILFFLFLEFALLRIRKYTEQKRSLNISIFASLLVYVIVSKVSILWAPILLLLTFLVGILLSKNNMISFLLTIGSFTISD